MKAATAVAEHTQREVAGLCTAHQGMYVPLAAGEQLSLARDWNPTSGILGQDVEALLWDQHYKKRNALIPILEQEALLSACICHSLHVLV